MKERYVKKVFNGRNTKDGAGVKLVRVFAKNEVIELDPFLMLDAFDSDNPDDYIKGFPWHPHRGIETITYLIEGEIIHEDSLNNSGVIRDGDCQWMTAGSGILHQEMPQGSSKMYGLQIWLNLPRESKMTSPRYNDIYSKDVPAIVEDGLCIRIIAGEFQNEKGAFMGEYVKPLILDISAKKDKVFTHKTNIEENSFLYVFKGKGIVGKDEILEKTAVVFSSGDVLKLTSLTDDFRFMFFSAIPLKEPIAWGGPIVMNTDEELKTAFAELDSGKFIRESAK